MSTKKPKRRATNRRASTSAPASSPAPTRAARRTRSERPVSDKRVAGEIMGALLTAITFGALEAA